MRKISFKPGLVICGLIFFIASCTIDRSPLAPKEKKDTKPPKVGIQEEIINANNTFSFALFSQVNKEKQSENVFISPFSVSMALGMTLNGANGQTYTAMQKTLGFEGLNETSIDETYASLRQALQQLDSSVVFEIANSIWCRQGIAFKPEFLTVNQMYFNAEVRTLNFSDPQSVTTINNWISDATHGKIRNVLDMIPAEAVMYLINALYFNGIWTYQFPEDEVKSRPFYQLDGSSVQCQMMFVTCRIPALIDENIQVAQLPYGQGNYVMTIIMPENANTFNDYLQTFDQAEWNRIQENLKQDSCTIALPKFRFGFKSLLNNTLAKMGMDIVFSGGADFSRISDTHALQISRVIHQTFVEVSEKGTEAAAVTIVEFTDTWSGPRILNITFDHPFIFIISEKSTGAVLFMGKMLRPMWN